MVFLNLVLHRTQAPRHKEEDIHLTNIVIVTWNWYNAQVQNFTAQEKSIVFLSHSKKCYGLHVKSRPTWCVYYYLSWLWKKPLIAM